MSEVWCDLGEAELVAIVVTVCCQRSWRGVRAAEGAGFENQCADFPYRGFESRPLR